jgi:hypothetical protein
VLVRAATLAKTNDLNGISLVESKIDEFVRTAGTESAWQIVALDDLKQEITDRGWGTPCSGHILDYIARQHAAIAAKCEPLNDRPPQTPVQPNELDEDRERTDELRHWRCRCRSIGLVESDASLRRRVGHHEDALGTRPYRIDYTYRVTVPGDWEPNGLHPTYSVALLRSKQ